MAARIICLDGYGRAGNGGEDGDGGSRLPEFPSVEPDRDSGAGPPPLPAPSESEAALKVKRGDSKRHVGKTAKLDSLPEVEVAERETARNKERSRGFF